MSLVLGVVFFPRARQKSSKRSAKFIEMPHADESKDEKTGLVSIHPSATIDEAADSTIDGEAIALDIPPFENAPDLSDIKGVPGLCTYVV